MRQEFHSLFSLLSRDYVSRIMGRRAAPIFDIFRKRTISNLVENAITSAEQALPKGKRLRPDARHFLLVNLTEMVAAPLTVSNDRFLSSEDQTATIEIEQDLKHDTTLIARVASEMSEEDEVSSNSIVRALAKSLETLRLNRFEIWG